MQNLRCSLRIAASSNVNSIRDAGISLFPYLHEARIEKLCGHLELHGNPNHCMDDLYCDFKNNWIISTNKNKIWPTTGIEHKAIL